jgi:hypothetical protein
MSLPTLPRPDDAAIHVHGEGGTLGPFSRRVLYDRVKDGSAKPDDSFWFEGMDGWAKLSRHPDLFADVDGSVKHESADDRADSTFGKLIQASWSYYNAHKFASHVDEVFLGAIITTVLDTGYALIDLTSDGTHHYVRFQNLEDNARILVRLTHLTGDLTRAKVQGHRASVIIGYGERMDDFSRIFQALKAEVKSGYIQSPEPGTITVDGDLNTGYVYVSVDLYLCVDDYVPPSYMIKYDVLQDHLGSTVHALRKYLRGRFGGK